jgi:hypothetical protein
VKENTGHHLDIYEKSVPQTNVWIVHYLMVQYQLQLLSTGMEMVVAYFKVVSLHSPGEN